MTTEVRIPHIGESISEVQIAEWLKSDGDEVKKDENVAVIDSEKTTLELPAPEEGRLRIIHQSGENVSVGEVIARIEVAKGTTEKSEAFEPQSGVAKGGKKNASFSAKDTQKGRQRNGEIVDQDLNIKRVTGAGKEPIKEAAESSQPSQSPERSTGAEKATGQFESDSKSEIVKTQKPSQILATGGPPPTALETSLGETVTEKIVPMTMMRRTIAKRLVEAKLEMAMLTTFNEVDMSAVQSLRREQQENFENRCHAKLGYMSFFVKAVATALKQFPQLNASIRENDIVYHKQLDIGVAIASGRGLIVPVLRDSEKLTFAETERSIADFARRALEGKVQPAELEGGTFTITNGGVFGSLLSTPIINPPQSGILGMHSIQERPIALNGQVAIRPMMYVALTYDHRLVDGREAVLFLRKVKDVIDNPARMLLEM